eukprot:1160707-Pelagomonas_calceolata.AAC.5
MRKRSGSPDVQSGGECERARPPAAAPPLRPYPYRQPRRLACRLPHPSTAAAAVSGGCCPFSGCGP